jgi:diguanylate cyclase
MRLHRQPDDRCSVRDSTDTLTGLVSQRRLEEALATAIADAVARDAPLCVVTFGIDRFETFNEKWGEANGEQVLRLVARCIGAGTRDRDWAARFGEDGFAAVLPDRTRADASQVAAHIRNSVQAKTLVRKHTGEALGSVTLSAGMAELVPGDTPTLMLARARTSQCDTTGQRA